jgi:hypothetical protein
MNIQSSELYAIAPEIALTSLRMLLTAHFGSSSQVCVSALNVVWRREQSNDGGSVEQGTMRCRK